MPITFIDHSTFLTEAPATHDFWIDHLIPKNGVVLLWGYTSIGKSPLSWHLALAIANGQPFFYLPVQQGRVLYIELDTVRALVHRRARYLPDSPNLRWAFAPSLVIDTPDWHALHQEALRYKPEVVFINTLRKAHSGSDIESHVPSEVYQRFQKLFPGATIVFIHHARKVSPKADSSVPKGEGFSGSQAWQNDATLAARLYRCKDSEDEGTYLALDVTKSQVGPTGELLRLYLGPDGVTLSAVDYSAVIMTLNANPTISNKQIAELLNVSESTIHRAKRKQKTLKTPDTPLSPLESIP